MSERTYYLLNTDAVESAVKTFDDAYWKFGDRDWDVSDREDYESAAVVFAEQMRSAFASATRHKQGADTARIQADLPAYVRDVQHMISALDMLRISPDVRPKEGAE